VQATFLKINAKTLNPVQCWGRALPQDWDEGGLGEGYFCFYKVGRYA